MLNKIYSYNKNNLYNFFIMQNDKSFCIIYYLILPLRSTIKYFLFFFTFKKVTKYPFHSFAVLIFYYHKKRFLLNKIVVFHFVPNSIFFFISSFIKITIYDSLSFLSIALFINSFLLIRRIYGCTNDIFINDTLPQTQF